MVAAQLKAAMAVDQQHDLAAHGQEGYLRVGAKAALAGEADARLRYAFERCGDLGAGSVQRGAVAGDIAAETAEAIGIEVPPVR